MLGNAKHTVHQMIVFFGELPSSNKTVTFGYIRSEQVFVIALGMSFYGSYLDSNRNSETVTILYTEGFRT